MRITSDGNIRLTSNNASNASFDLNYRFSTPDSARIRFSTTSDFNQNEPGELSFWTRANDAQGGGLITERMRITSGGNVGIGTTTPISSSGYTTLSLNSSTGGQIEFKTGDTGKAYIYSNSTDLRFYTGGGTFRFENTTGVEIGYSASQGLYKLDVNGTGRFSGNLTVGGNINIYSSVIPSIVALTPTFWGYSSSYPVVMLGSSGSASTVAIGYNPSGNANGSFSGNGDEILFRNGARFTTPNSANNSFYLNHLVLKDGEVLIGTNTSNSNKLRVNGTIFSDSSVTATSFFESSDATLKTLVEDDYQAKGIDSVVAKLYMKNGKQELGYYAQDLEGVLPSAVSKGSDGLLNLSYREVHTAKIAYLEQKIKQLENELGRFSK
jgi:hypothetical protein